MKRNMLFLTVVLAVLVALMVPSFAMAEAAAATPTLKIGEKTKVEEKLTGDLWTVTPEVSGITWTASGFTTDWRIEWSSANNSAIWIYEEDATADYGKDDVQVTHPTLHLDREDCVDETITITGKVSVKDANYNTYRPLTTISFPVTMKFVPAAKITGFEKTSYEFYATTAQDFNDQVKTAEPAEGAEVVRGTYEGWYDQYRWMVDNTEYAEVDRYGEVTVKKLPKDKAVNVKLTVWAKGDESNTASTTLVIEPELPEEEEESVEQPGGYTYLAFRADTFTFSEDDGDFWLNGRAYLDWKGNQGGQDNLIWSSSDIAVATVYNGDFAEHNDDYDNNGGRLNIKKASTEPITITVRSKMNPAVKATCKVVIKAKDADKEEAKKAYTSMEFAEESLTVYKDDESIDLRNYLIVAPYECGDEIIWTCDDNKVVELDGYRLKGRDAGEATVTAKSRNGDKQASIKITVIEGEGVEKKPYEEVTTALSALTLYEGDEYYLGQFVDAKPMNGDDSLVWVSSDKNIVEVAYQYEDRGDGYIWARNAGEATITAKSKLGDKKAEIKVTVKKASEKKVPFTDVHFAVDSLTLYVGEREYLKPKYIEPAPDKANDALVWSSSDYDIVYVGYDEDGNDGVVWANNPGEATITAKSRYGEKKAELKITVKEQPKVAYSAINLDKTAITLYEGDEEWLMWNVVWPEPDPSDDHLMWTSSDETVVGVEHDWWDEQWDEETDEMIYRTQMGFGGRVYANKEGKATITVRSYLKPELAKTIEVTVKAREEKTFDSISFTADKFEVKKSAWGFDPIGYIVFDPIREDVNLQDLVWTSSDEKIATVDEGGYVHFNDFSTEKETVTISVRAKNNPKKAAKSFELTIVNDDTYYESIEFTAEKYAVKFTDGTETHWEEDEDGEGYEVTYPETFDANQYLLTDPMNDWEVRDSILWTSSDPQIAEVYGGNVILHKLGTVTITARSEHNAKAKGSFELEIKDALTPIESIATTQEAFSLTTPDDGLYLGQYLDVKPVENDDDLVWTSSDPEVLNVARGIVKLGLPGEATITVRSKMNSKVSATISVKVEEEKVEKLKFIKDTPTTLSEKKGTLRLTKYLTSEPWYYAVPDKGYTGKLVWTTSNPQIATVENGVVYYQAPGKVRITVSDEDGEVKASVKLTMTEVPVTKIVPSTKTLKLSVGERFELVKNIKAIKPANASYGKYDIVWSSSNGHVAYIEDVFDEEDGEYLGTNVIAKEVGTTKITALIRNKDGSAVTATFKVKVTETDIEKIKFAKSKYTFKTDKGYANLKYTVTPADANFDPEKDLDVQSNFNRRVKVVAVNDRYVTVQIDEPGTAVITIKSKADGKVFCKTKVVVEPVELTGIQLKEKTVKMNFYQIDENHLYQNIHTLYPIIRPTNAYHITKWETSNASVAFVNNWGPLDSTSGEKDSSIKSSSSSWSSSGREYAEVVATGEGTATLKMTVSDGKNTFTKKVKVIVSTKQVDLKLNKKKAKITMLKGADNTLQLEAYDNDTDEAVNVKWTSSNKAVATVDKNGLVTALKAGEAVITATTKDGNKVQATCKLTVEKLAVESVKGKAKLTMKVGGEKDLSVKVAPSNAYDTGLKFKSSKPGIVSVDANGHLVAKKAGKATITAKATDGSKKTLKIEVTVKEAE